jgi:hypothetical protein
MLHNPMQYLKADNGRHGSDRRERINTIRDLFQLDDQDDSQSK